MYGRGYRRLSTNICLFGPGYEISLKEPTFSRGWVTVWCQAIRPPVWASNLPWWQEIYTLRVPWELVSGYVISLRCAMHTPTLSETV